MAGPNLHGLFKRKVGTKTGLCVFGCIKECEPRLDARFLRRICAESRGRPARQCDGRRRPAADKVLPLTAFVMRQSGSVDWDAPKSETIATGGLDAELRADKPEFWAQYMENTIKFTIPGDNGETYSFVAYFNEDGTITGNNRGLQGIWRMRDKRKFCYSLERVGRASL